MLLCSFYSLLLFLAQMRTLSPFLCVVQSDTWSVGSVMKWDCWVSWFKIHGGSCIWVGVGEHSLYWETGKFWVGRADLGSTKEEDTESGHKSSRHPSVLHAVGCAFNTYLFSSLLQRCMWKSVCYWIITAELLAGKWSRKGIIKN